MRMVSQIFFNKLELLTFRVASNIYSMLPSVETSQNNKVILDDLLI